jgi:hypothetical protein
LFRRRCGLHPRGWVGSRSRGFGVGLGLAGLAGLAAAARAVGAGSRSKRSSVVKGMRRMGKAAVPIPGRELREMWCCCSFGSWRCCRWRRRIEWEGRLGGQWVWSDNGSRGVRDRRHFGGGLLKTGVLISAASSLPDGGRVKVTWRIDLVLVVVCGVSTGRIYGRMGFQAVYLQTSIGGSARVK